jgi:hypothetical protein
MRLTGPQQLIGDGIVVWLIVQCLEAKVSSGALPHKSAGITPWAFKRRTVSRIGISFSISIGMAFQSLPFRHKLESNPLANLNW